MAGFTDVLRKSFRMLLDEPRLFAPKILSMAVSSAWLVLFMSGQISYFDTLILLPFIGVIGMVASLMVASMVKDRNRENLLKTSFIEALYRWREVLVVSFLVIVIGFMAAVPVTFGLLYYAETGSVALVAAGILLMIGIMLGVGYASYFLPITILEKKSFLGGLKESTKTSRENYREVTALLFVSLALLGLAFASDRYLQYLGYAGFIAGRLVSTVVNTYLFVVSPTFYLEE